MIRFTFDLTIPKKEINRAKEEKNGFIAVCVEIKEPRRGHAYPMA